MVSPISASRGSTDTEEHKPSTGIDWIKDTASGLKDGMMDGLKMPFRWADAGPTETSRKVRAFIVATGIALIGALAITIVLASTGAFSGGGMNLSMTTLPILLLGIAVTGLGVSMLVNQLVLKHLFKGPKGDEQRRQVAQALNALALICALATVASLLAITYQGGLAYAAKHNTGMIVFSSTVTLVILSVVAKGLVDSTDKHKYRGSFKAAPLNVKLAYYNQGKGALHKFGFAQRLMPATTA